MKKAIPTAIVIGLLSLLMAGCSNSFAVFMNINNESGQELWVESNIFSEYCRDTLEFALRDGATNRVARSGEYSGKEVPQDPIPYLVDNDDAYVRIYKPLPSGKRVLLRTWYLSDRNSGNRELFSPQYLKEDHYSESGGYSFSVFRFIILPEDIEEK